MKKTEDSIPTSFICPRLHEVVTRFRRSCNVCQKSIARGSVSRVPVSDMLLIDQPFKRVTVTVVGLTAAAGDKGNRYILTLVDCATRYSNADS